jgi:hypothetical protein
MKKNFFYGEDVCVTLDTLAFHRVHPYRRKLAALATLSNRLGSHFDELASKRSGRHLSTNRDDSTIRCYRSSTAECCSTAQQGSLLTRNSFFFCEACASTTMPITTTISTCPHPIANILLLDDRSSMYTAGIFFYSRMIILCGYEVVATSRL